MNLGQEVNTQEEESKEKPKSTQPKIPVADDPTDEFLK